METTIARHTKKTDYISTGEIIGILQAQNRNLIVTMKQFLKLLFVCFIGACFIVSCKKSTTKFIVIRNDFGLPTVSKKVNAVILVTDNQELYKAEKLANHYIEEIRKERALTNEVCPCIVKHKCIFEFYSQKDSFSDRIALDYLDDDKFNNKLNHYLRLLQKSPNYYSYNLEIQSKANTSQVLQAIKNNGNIILGKFPPEGALEFLDINFFMPFINSAKKGDMQYRKELMKTTKVRLQTILNRVNKIEPIVKQSKFRCIDSTQKGIEELVSISFKPGADLSKVKALLRKERAHIYLFYNPLWYYVEILDKSESIELLKNKYSKYPFISGIYDFPEQRNNDSKSNELPPPPDFFSKE
jgi:hypothetical protein